MRPLPPAAAPSHGTFALPWEADEAWVVTDPDELRSHLDGIPPARRRRVRVLGELSNTIPAEQVPGTVLLFRDGTGTRLEPVDDGTALVTADASRAIDDLDFGYRTSALKPTTDAPPPLVLLRVTCRVRPEADGDLAYEELARHHADQGRGGTPCVGPRGPRPQGHGGRCPDRDALGGPLLRGRRRAPRGRGRGRHRGPRGGLGRADARLVPARRGHRPAAPCSAGPPRSTSTPTSATTRGGPARARATGDG